MRARTTVCRQKARQLVAAVQATDLLSQRLVKEVQGVVNACAHYSLSPEGILLWEGKLSIPQQRSLINELWTIHQDDPQAGSWGVTKTLEPPQRKFKWFRMEAKPTPKCTSKRVQPARGSLDKGTPAYESLVPLPQPGRPRAEISMDGITGLPPSYKGERVQLHIDHC